MNTNEKMKILAAAGKNFDFEQLKSILEPEYSVIPVSGPSQIIGQAVENMPDLIIVPQDYEGFDISAINTELSNHYNTACIPVLSLVEIKGADQITALYNSGVSDYVQLPLVEAELKNRVKTYIELSILRGKVNALDDFTGIFNRHAFVEKARLELIRFKRTKNNLIIAGFHIDQLPEIEQKYGEQAANTVFAGIVAEIKQQLRDTDLIGRFEKHKVFAMLIDTSRLEGILVADRIIDKIKTMIFDTADGQLQSTISVGFTPVNADDKTIQGVIERANKALQHAQKSGNNSVEIE